jgi:hypothetical protein
MQARPAVALLLPLALALAGFDADAQPAGGSVASLETRLETLAGQLRELGAVTARQQQAIAQLRADNQSLAGRLHCVLSFSTATDFVFNGCNVHIQNGAGSTSTANRYGNLIIGYDKNEVATRTGSHNLVIGDLHEYTSYGGIVTGTENTLSAPNSAIFASVDSEVTGTGGAAVIGADRGDSQGNAVLIGGSMNYASVDGRFGVVIGGSQNGVTAGTAVAVAGTMNVGGASGALACGGAENQASGTNSMACGGDGNQSPGSGAVAIGGTQNQAAGSNSVETGGNHCSTGAVSSKWIVGLQTSGCSAFAN